MIILLASPTLGLSPGPPSFPFQFGKGSVEDPARARSQNEAGSSNPSRRARLFDLVWLSVPPPEVTSHFRRGFSSANTWPLGLGLLRRRRSGRFLLECFTAAPAEQRQGVLGTEGEAANGLFTGGAQSDVDAAVVGQAHGQQVFQDLLLFRRAQVRVGFDQVLDLLGGHVLFKAKRSSLNAVRGYALLHQVVLGAFHAALGEFHVVVLGPANVRMAFENQVSVRP